MHLLTKFNAEDRFIYVEALKRYKNETGRTLLYLTKNGLYARYPYRKHSDLSIFWWFFDRVAKQNGGTQMEKWLAKLKKPAKLLTCATN